MTDITELAQRLKLEVHRAVSNFNPQMNIKTRDLKELVEALEKSEKTSEARREAIDRTHNMFVRERDRANAAEEALEKAQQRITQLESRTVKMPEPFKLAKSSSGLTYYFADDVDAALTAAGIKWEVE
ncbi:hypothetical protein [Klebsiella michiganensis]|uniref:hypothetical protein n=1 Tax=Klebsiella michiganensis TaxID=1134687 RepID=UPI0019534585|nr:hypothetical protein [Klebsiella michiganensis]